MCNSIQFYYFISVIKVVLFILIKRTQFVTTEIKCIYIKINTSLTSKINESVHANIPTIILSSSQTQIACLQTSLLSIQLFLLFLSFPDFLRQQILSPTYFFGSCSDFSPLSVCQIIQNSLKIFSTKFYMLVSLLKNMFHTMHSNKNHSLLFTV
jgi:hypothetical protein